VVTEGEKFLRDVTDRLPGLEGPNVVIEPSNGALYTPSAGVAQLHTPPDLASEQDILGAFAGALRVCGVVGEERNAKLIYLALSSRILEEPVSLAAKGVSSVGKSYTLEATLRFFPSEAFFEMTAMSERALVYSKDSFEHRTLVLFEAVALRESGRRRSRTSPPTSSGPSSAKGAFATPSRSATRTATSPPR
jgi:hypothetical protein